MACEEQREGRRERRTRETRRRILEAAVELFAARGVDAVTVEEVADRADVARGTVFNYFASKEALCQQLGELQVDLLREAVADGRVVGPSAGEKIEQALRVLAELPGMNADNCRLLLARGLTCSRPGELPEHRRALFGMLQEWVEEGQRQGEFRSDYLPCELAGFLMGLQLQATLTWAYGFVAGTLPDHVARLLRLALEGMNSRSTCSIEELGGTAPAGA